MKLLSPGSTNTKIAKNSKFDRYLSAILHLAPSDVSGYDVCPAASSGCKMSCLNTAGRGRFDNVQQARIRKTKLFFQNRSEFMQLLIKDLIALQKKAFKENKIPVVRLNGTSDIKWEEIYIDNESKLTVFDMFPLMQFYDYSKIASRFNKLSLPKNYYLIFSSSESNDIVAKRVMKLGFNIAMVFDNVPSTYWNTEVISGEDSDMRFLEGYQGKIVGLVAKGKAKKDQSGFVKKIA